MDYGNVPPLCHQMGDPLAIRCSSYCQPRVELGAFFRDHHAKEERNLRPEGRMSARIGRPLRASRDRDQSQSLTGWWPRSSAPQVHGGRQMERRSRRRRQRGMYISEPEAVLALPAPSEEHLGQQDQKEEERQTIAQPESGRYQRSVEIHALAPPFKSRRKSMPT